MSDKLTWPEIKARHPDEWVVLVDVDEIEEELEIRSGVVLGHGKNKKELLARAKEAASGSSGAILFTGDVGKGSFLF